MCQKIRHMPSGHLFSANFQNGTTGEKWGRKGKGTKDKKHQRWKGGREGDKEGRKEKRSGQSLDERERERKERGERGEEKEREVADMGLLNRRVIFGPIICKTSKEAKWMDDVL